MPKMSRHRPSGTRFSSPAASTLRANFTTHIMSCLDGAVHAIGDITVDTVLRDGALAWFPKVMLTLAPFVLPKDVRDLFAAADGRNQPD